MSKSTYQNILAQYEKILDKIALKYRDKLIRKKTVISKYEELNDNDARFLAKSSFYAPIEQYLSEADWDFWDNPGQHSYIDHLKEGTFRDLRIKGLNSKTQEKIQNRFTDGWQRDGEYWPYASYKEVQERNYLLAARTYLKKLSVYLCIFLALIVAGVWGIYKYEQAQHLKQYWAKINSPEKYNGDGFTAVFPCTGVTTYTYLSDSDLRSSQSSCSYFGGADKMDIDTYTVEVVHFLSNQYKPSDSMTCGNLTTYETRIIHGSNFIICGLDDGSYPILAHVQSGNTNTVFTLSVSQSGKNTTGTKLDNFIRGFQATTQEQ